MQQTVGKCHQWGLLMSVRGVHESSVCRGLCTTSSLFRDKCPSCVSVSRSARAKACRLYRMRVSEHDSSLSLSWSHCIRMSTTWPKTRKVLDLLKVLLLRCGRRRHGQCIRTWAGDSHVQGRQRLPFEHSGINRYTWLPTIPCSR